MQKIPSTQLSCMASSKNLLYFAKTPDKFSLGDFFQIYAVTSLWAEP